MRFDVLLFFLILNSTLSRSQSLSSDSAKNPLTISAYGEFYYSYDFSSPMNKVKPNFIYNHNRHSEITANLIYVKANYQQLKYRANLGAMVGTYAEYNLASEPTWAQFIYEANVGFKLAKKQQLWLDVGIMPSHLGFESFVGADCWTLTRSILAENSPYYESGLRLSYTSENKKFYSSFLVLNGWQRIQKINGFSNLPSIGFQLQYKPKDGLIFNYSNFVGQALPDSMDAIRNFHNFYIQYEPNSKLGLILGFDIGMDKYSFNDYGVWYSPVVILKYKLSPKWTVAGRFEYYDDRKRIIIATPNPNGFQTFGCSSNVDFKLAKGLVLRMEYKYFQAAEAIFHQGTSSNHSITSACTFSF